MADVLSWKTVSIRKPHRCFGCAKEYVPPLNMVRAAYVDSGSVSTEYWCKTCEEYMSRYFEYGDETGYGELYGEDRECWNRLNEELMSTKA